MTSGFRLRYIVYAAIAIILIVAICVGGAAGCKGFNRYQKRADAKNRVKVSEIEIRNQAQRVEIAKQQAEIRVQEAIGIRESQDQIAATLTPLYVQFEMIRALQDIAASGANNSVVFIPSGEAGVPIITQLPATSGATK